MFNRQHILIVAIIVLFSCSANSQGTKYTNQKVEKRPQKVELDPRNDRQELCELDPGQFEGSWTIYATGFMHVDMGTTLTFKIVDSTSEPPTLAAFLDGEQFGDLFEATCTENKTRLDGTFQSHGCNHRISIFIQSNSTLTGESTYEKNIDIWAGHAYTEGDTMECFPLKHAGVAHAGGTGTGN